MTYVFFKAAGCCDIKVKQNLDSFSILMNLQKVHSP